MEYRRGGRDRPRRPERSERNPYPPSSRRSRSKSPEKRHSYRRRSRDRSRDRERDGHQNDRRGELIWRIHRGDYDTDQGGAPAGGRSDHGNDGGRDVKRYRDRSRSPKRDSRNQFDHRKPDGHQETRHRDRSRSWDRNDRRRRRGNDDYDGDEGYRKDRARSPRRTGRNGDAAVALKSIEPTDTSRLAQPSAGSAKALDEVEFDEQDDEAAMQALMGFGDFGTTKERKVVGNDVGTVRKAKKSEYRQYMNRIGGFNRALSPA